MILWFNASAGSGGWIVANPHNNKVTFAINSTLDVSQTITVTCAKIGGYDQQKGAMNRDKLNYSGVAVDCKYHIAIHRPQIHTWCLVRSTARRHAKDALMNWIEAAISAKLGFFQATGVRGADTWPMNNSLNSSDIETIILGTSPSMLLQTIGYLFGGEPMPLLASSNVVNQKIVYSNLIVIKCRQ